MKTSRVTGNIVSYICIFIHYLKSTLLTASVSYFQTIILSITTDDKNFTRRSLLFLKLLVITMFR